MYVNPLRIRPISSPVELPSLKVGVVSDDQIRTRIRVWPGEVQNHPVRLPRCSKVEVNRGQVVALALSTLTSHWMLSGPLSNSVRDSSTLGVPNVSFTDTLR